MIKSICKMCGMLQTDIELSDFLKAIHEHQYYERDVSQDEINSLNLVAIEIKEAVREK